MVIKWGMSQAASDAYVAAGHDIWRIGQTIGSAVLSAGTHMVDGKDEFGNEYSAAVDISVRNQGSTGSERSAYLPDDTIKQIADDLFAKGFFPFPRLPWHPEDGWPDIAHMHCIYLGESMKEPLQSQVHDGFAGKTGLVGHRPYHFWKPTDETLIEKNRELFLAHNPA